MTRAAYVDKGDVSLSVELMNESQYVSAYVMCDEIGMALLDPSERYLTAPFSWNVAVRGT